MDKKKTILITGTSSGIGRATAKHFAQKGWNVLATMRNPEGEHELNQLTNVLLARLDVQKPDTVASAIQAGIHKFGAIDVLLNNAGYGEFGVFESATEAHVRTQFEVNVFGVMDTIRTILPHFRARKKGLIINVSSGAGRFTLPMLSLYASSKFALEGFSEALSFELSALNIGVKIIEPGGTVTNFNKVSGERFTTSPTLSAYDDFIAAAGQLFASMVENEMTTAEQVAEAIYGAATDGTDNLRYVVGTDGFKARVAARLTMPDQEYVNSVKNGYMPYMPQP